LDQFKTSHGSSHCLECSNGKIVIRLQDRVEDTCIQCGETKPRDQFRRLFHSGSKCIACVDANDKSQKKRYNKKYFQRCVNTPPKSESKCKVCGEIKSSDHFTKVKTYGGLSKVCNECKESRKNFRYKESKNRKASKRHLCSRNTFEKQLNNILEEYPSCRIMSEEEYMGCVICSDMVIRKVSGKKYRGLCRKLEHLYFKYFAPDKSMDDYYVDFSKGSLVRFETISNKGRPLTTYNRTDKIYRDKKRKDPLWRLQNSMTSSFCQWMGGKKGNSTWKYVDYTLEELKDHLESLFTEGMTWDNYGWDGWWVDHIIPRDSFDMNDPEQIRECWQLSNLQPLWKEDNLAKGNTVVDK
jgi:hypothetical protein